MGKGPRQDENRSGEGRTSAQGGGGGKAEQAVSRETDSARGAEDTRGWRAPGGLGAGVGPAESDAGGDRWGGGATRQRLPLGRGGLGAHVSAIRCAWGPRGSGRAQAGSAKSRGDCGGARAGARGGGSGGRPSRCRMERMTGGAVMTAMRRRGAPQMGQVRTSTANTRANKVAHGRPWRAERRLPGAAGIGLGRGRHCRRRGRFPGARPPPGRGVHDSGSDGRGAEGPARTGVRSAPAAGRRGRGCRRTTGGGGYRTLARPGAVGGAPGPAAAGRCTGRDVPAAGDRIPARAHQHAGRSPRGEHSGSW